jgi:coproporphyrinogen III oxidase
MARKPSMSDGAKTTQQHSSLEEFKRSKQYKELQWLAVDMITREAIASGRLKPRGLAPIELQRIAVKEFLSTKNKKLLFAIDHCDNIRLWASKFEAEGEYALAVLMEATWLEHAINQIVEIYGNRRKLSPGEIVQIIRETNFRGKVGWLPRLLRAPRIPATHANAMNKLLDVRNEFVHYKWKGEEDPDRTKKRYAEALTQFAVTRRFVQRYLTKHVYKNYKTHVAD